MYPAVPPQIGKHPFILVNKKSPDTFRDSNQALQKEKLFQQHYGTGSVVGSNIAKEHTNVKTHIRHLSDPLFETL